MRVSILRELEEMSHHEHCFCAQLMLVAVRGNNFQEEIPVGSLSIEALNGPTM